MDNLQIIFLSIVQGLTEFLPISSSAHLILVPRMLGWSDQGLVFDVGVHFGSLIAVVAYFRNEVRSMLWAWIGSLRGGDFDADARLAWWVIVGTLPAVAVGFFAEHAIETQLRTPLIIAAASIVSGLLLWYADVRAKRTRDEYDLNLCDVLIIGCMQVLAMIPGTSRAGITITAGLLLGMSRRAAARFSFLLAMPVIFASGALETRRMFVEAIPIGWGDLLLGVLLSAISAAICIHVFLRLVERVGMLPFVIYKVLLGLLIVAVLA